MTINRHIRPTWAEIDLAAFERNVQAVAAMLPAGSRLIAVLKADGYGHGAVELARRCRSESVAMIATSLLEESLELRNAGIELPLLVLGPLREEQVRLAVENGVTMGVAGPEQLEIVARCAPERGVEIQLKVDSGMGRMGMVETDVGRIAAILRSTPRLRVEAIYTHLANAENRDDPFTEEQADRFGMLVGKLSEEGISAPLHHIANSAAMARGLVRPGDWVRAGLALYGAEPVRGWRLEPLLLWRTEIARIKEIPSQHAVGYGTTWRAPRPSRIATLPVGYADGYRRGLSNCAEVLVRGRRAPVVGRVSMDLVTIDITDVGNAAVGDEVVLLGRQGDGEISVEELASKLDTISYEVFCGIGARVPRVHLDRGASRSGA